MFMSQQMMRKVDRSIPKALFLDEAWQMMRGGAMAEFIEAFARTCRKYYASLITATQSLNDYYKRSEEHTSELQSLMRISYAVFCLKKKKKKNKNKSTETGNTKN